MRKIFLGSTTEGLRPYRDAVIEMIGRLASYTCEGAEEADPRSPSSLGTVRRKVADADIYIGILGPDYGACPSGSEISFPEHEYYTARDNDLIMLVFATPEVPRDDGLLDQRQRAFRASVMRHDVIHTIDLSLGPEGLSAAVAACLVDLMASDAAAQKSRVRWSLRWRPAPRAYSPLLSSFPIFQFAFMSRLFRYLLYAITATMAIGPVVIVFEHLLVLMHRYPSDQIEVPPGHYRINVEASPLLTVMRGLDSIPNINFLLDPDPTSANTDSYYLDRTEVTNFEYKKFLTDQKSRKVNEPAFWSDANLNQPQQPVVGVTWAEAEAFCRVRGKRLPTGDEWERASRGQDGRLYPWGNRADARAANTIESLLQLPAKVGTFPGDQTPEGVMDLGGNVREWTTDGRPGNTPTGRATVQGASYRNRGDIYSLGYLRISTDPENRQPDIGFRCAKSLESVSAVDIPGMALILGGTFRKGSEDQWLLNLARKFHLNGDGIRRLIAITREEADPPGFAIDRTEVTNEAYRKFLAAMGGRLDPRPAGSNGKATYEPDELSWSDSRLNQPNQPVVGVDWYDAAAFCRWLGERLPTSAEWERAASGPQGFRYPWGNEFERGRCNTADGTKPEKRTSEVGKFSRCVTPSGIADLVGNADEWTATAVPDPRNRDIRLVRGGSWDEAGELRGLTRYSVSADALFQSPDLGFRCVSDPRRSWLETMTAIFK